MATQTVLEKLSGTAEAALQPVHVYDDGEPPATIAVAAAVTAAQAAAPSTILGVEQDANVQIEQLADFSWRITVPYRVRKLSKLTPLGSLEYRYNFDVAARAKVMRFAPTVNEFTDGNPWVSPEGMLTANGKDLNSTGVPITPPTPNAGVEIYVPAGLITPSLVNKTRAVVGSVNSAVIAGWQPGEVYVNRVSFQQTSDDLVAIRMQWSLQDNVTASNPETRGDVSGIAYNAHDYVWEWMKVLVGRDENVLAWVPRAVIVSRVWPYANHNNIEVAPPQKSV